MREKIILEHATDGSRNGQVVSREGCADRDVDRGLLRGVVRLACNLDPAPDHREDFLADSGPRCLDAEQEVRVRDVVVSGDRPRGTP